VFRPTEIKMMLAAFANMETVHIAAYALLLETLGMPDSEFAAFLDYGAMRDKHDYLQTFGVETDGDILRTLAMFGGFAEGLQLFASFAILLNFPRHNKMRGMGQVVSWSVRDETLHCEGIIRLFHTFASETGALTDAVRDDIVECARNVVRLEDRFIELAFEQGAHGAAERRRARELLRDARDGIREGRNRRGVARRGRSVGIVRPASLAPRAERVARPYGSHVRAKLRRARR
jgi:ribonucleoside-diphosphate reductase beta chain